MRAAIERVTRALEASVEGAPQEPLSFGEFAVVANLVTQHYRVGSTRDRELVVAWLGDLIQEV